MIGNQVQVNQMWGMSENGVRITEKGRPQGRERQKKKIVLMVQEMVLKTDQLEKDKMRERTTEQAGRSSQQSCVTSLFKQSSHTQFFKTE